MPNFKVLIEDEGETYDVHFAGLFSQKKDATPLLLSHGWPGEFHPPSGYHRRSLINTLRLFPRVPAHLEQGPEAIRL